MDGKNSRENSRSNDMVMPMGRATSIDAQNVQVGDGNVQINYILQEATEKYGEDESKKNNLKNLLEKLRSVRDDNSFVTLVKSYIAKSTSYEKLLHALGDVDEFNKSLKQKRREDEKKHRVALRNFKEGMILYEDGAWEDLKMAVERFNISAMLGHSDAQYYLGTCYLDGKGVRKDVDKAIEWLSLSAENGCVYAQEALAQIYLGEKYNLSEGIGYLKMAVERGSIRAKRVLGGMYVQGAGEYHLSLGIRLLTEAAESGDDDAQWFLGSFYIDDVTQPEKVDKGVALLKESSAVGNPCAMLALGEYYEEFCNIEGSQQLATENYKKAIAIFTKFAENWDCTAQYYMGYCFYFGLGVCEDKEKALEWWKKAADIEPDFMSECMIGCCYMEGGDGVEQNHGKAVQWFNLAAKHGSRRAMYFLGKCYEYGYGVDKDFNKAKLWYEKAAALGDSDADERLSEKWE